MIASALKEDLRIDVLGRLSAVSVLGLRSDALYRSIRKDSRYAQLTEADLQTEVLIMVTHGWVAAKTNALAPNILNYKLTPKGKEFCYEEAIPDDA